MKRLFAAVWFVFAFTASAAFAQTPPTCCVPPQPPVQVNGPLLGDWIIGFPNVLSVNNNGQAGTLGSSELRVTISSATTQGGNGFISYNGVVQGLPNSQVYAYSDPMSPGYTEMVILIQEPFLGSSAYWLSVSCKLFVGQESMYGIMTATFVDNSASVQTNKILYESRAYAYRPGNGRG